MGFVILTEKSGDLLEIKPLCPEVWACVFDINFIILF